MPLSDLIAARGGRIATTFAIGLLAACSSEKMMSVHEPSPSVTSVDVPFCNVVAPNWLAFRDGDGAWTRALPVVEGQKIRFRHTFASDHAAIAAAHDFPGSNLTTLAVLYGRPEELLVAADTTPLHCGPAATKTLLGKVAGIDTNDVGAVSAGFGPGALISPSDVDFSLFGLVPGPQDILARRFSRVNDTKRLSRVILRRTPDLPDSTLISTLDFNSTEAFAPVLAHATLSGVELQGAILTTGLRTPYSQSFLATFDEPATGDRRTIVALPAERLHDGDLQIATLSAVPTADSRRSASVYFRVPDDRTLGLGATATLPALSTVATTPSLRLRATFDAQPDYDRLTQIAFVQDVVNISVSITSAYARVEGGYDLVVPDLSGVAGFDSRWGLHANQPVFWWATRIGGSLGLGMNAQPFPGATSRTGERSGTFNDDQRARQ